MRAISNGAQVINQLLLGQVLRKQFTAAEAVYFLTPSMCPVLPACALEAIASGELRPLNDGLFGSETSQSWAAG